MLLTVERHNIVRKFTGIDLRVLVNGEDVSADCSAADNETGWAIVYKRDADGRHYVGPNGKAAMDVLTGEVLFVRRADPPEDISNPTEIEG